MRARYYSPEMRRFINADIIYGQISDSTSLNRYAYVNGNPVSFVDPFGLERTSGNNAILLEYKEGATFIEDIVYFGHMGLLLQDPNGVWYLLYWGTENTMEAVLGSNEEVAQTILWQKLDEFEFTVDNTNVMVEEINTLIYGHTKFDPESDSTKITDAIYYEGDFSKSFEAAEKLYSEVIGGDSKQYNLYANNCMHVSMNILSKGEFSNYNIDHKFAIEHAKMLLIPNRSFKLMKSYEKLFSKLSSIQMIPVILTSSSEVRYEE